MPFICPMLWLGFACSLLITCFLSTKKSLMQLLVCVLISPVLLIGGQTVRIELVFVPVLLAISLSFRPLRFVHAFTRPCSIVLVGWLVWIIFASVLKGGVCIFGSVSWWMNVYGLTRLLMVFWLFSMFSWTALEVRQLFKLLALTVVPIGILSLSQVLGINVARAYTVAAYVPATSPVFQQQLEKEADGYVFRALGVFGNVSPNAFYFAIAAGCCLLALLREREVKQTILWLTCGLFCLLGGIATMSGTFIAGFPIIIVLCLWLSRKCGIRKRLLVLLGVLMLVVTVTLGIVYSIPQLKIQCDYQVDGLLSGERFKSRYDDEVGVTHEAVLVLSQNPLTGGFGREMDIFIGDSLFTHISYYGGYTGTVIFAAFLVTLFINIQRGGGCAYGTLWFLGAFVFGVSTTSIFTLRLSDWWWAIMGIMSARKIAHPFYKKKTRYMREGGTTVAGSIPSRLGQTCTGGD